MLILIYGLVTGILFGFLFQQSQVARYEKQVGALRLIDMTIFKFMLSAVIVGMVGIYALHMMELVDLDVKATHLGANIIGGLIFGVGWALLGYCPGTSVAALGEGRWDAMWGMLGMVIGAGVYAEAYPALKDTVLKWGALGKVTLPEVMGLDPLYVIPVLALVYIIFLVAVQKKGL